MKALVLPLAAALAACASTPPPGPGPTARLGEVATLNGLRIRPLRVIEDSRCPINARCVWAGRIILLTEVRSAAGRTTYDLTLGEQVSLAGGRLALVAAEPGRTAGTQSEAGAYRFTFGFSPG